MKKVITDRDSKRVTVAVTAISRSDARDVLFKRTYTHKVGRGWLVFDVEKVLLNISVMSRQLVGGYTEVALLLLGKRNIPI